MDWRYFIFRMHYQSLRKFKLSMGAIRPGARNRVHGIHYELSREFKVGTW